MPIASGGKGHEWFENIEGLMLASTVKTMTIILDRLMFSLLIFYFPVLKQSFPFIVFSI